MKRRCFLGFLPLLGINPKPLGDNRISIFTDNPPWIMNVDIIGGRNA